MTLIRKRFSLIVADIKWLLRRYARQIFGIVASIALVMVLVAVILLNSNTAVTTVEAPVENVASLDVRIASAADDVGTGLVGEVTIAVQVAASSDDAEENVRGHSEFSSGDLEMVQASMDQIVGLRFVGVEVPSGATITGAHLQFQADETNNVATTLLLQGQAADNPASFSNSDFNVSLRARTTASRSWSPPAWRVKGESGARQRTDDISGVIQEIVDRGGWSSSNAIVIIITGTGKRVAESYDGNQAGAPILTIAYIPRSRTSDGSDPP